MFRQFLDKAVLSKSIVNDGVFCFYEKPFEQIFFP